METSLAPFTVSELYTFYIVLMGGAMRVVHLTRLRRKIATGFSSLCVELILKRIDSVIISVYTVLQIFRRKGKEGLLLC